MSIRDKFENVSNVLRDHKPIVWISIATILTVVVIMIIDSNASTTVTRDYSEKKSEQEKNVRKSIPVEYSQFIELITTFGESNPTEMQGTGTPLFIIKDSVTTIDISKVSPSGKSLLAGTQMTELFWYTDTLCSFRTTQRENGDTVVDCPADLMIRLVENYEKVK